MARQYVLNGVLIQETGTRQYVVNGILANEGTVLAPPVIKPWGYAFIL